MNPKIAFLFRHYIDILAPWYDLCEGDRPFGETVPRRALDNSVLFKAIIAFAACHESRTSGTMQELELAFHAACVHDMLEVMDDFDPGLRGDYLAATCLLRSYEILTGCSYSKFTPS